VIRIIDKITEVAAHIAAWMLFSIAVMVTYEVVMRHYLGRRDSQIFSGVGGLPGQCTHFKSEGADHG